MKQGGTADSLFVLDRYESVRDFVFQKRFYDFLLYDGDFEF